MRSLVIDQATQNLGYAVVEDDPNFPVSFGVCGRLIQHGCIIAPVSPKLIDRLNVILADIRGIIRKYQVQEMVIEDTMFFRQRGGKTNHAMAAIFQMCRGVAAEHFIPIYYQNPNTIKLKMTGSGKATKEMVKEAVIRNWGIPGFRIQDDNHSDALAGAYVWLGRGDEKREKKSKKGKRGSAT